MDNRSPNETRRSAPAILIGYNLPFALWSAYAMWKAWVGGEPRWHCPLDSVVGVCPGCGLTTEYAALLAGRAVPGVWLTLILTLFLVNLVASCVKARRVVLRPTPPR